jgi:hypothetical protein
VGSQAQSRRVTAVHHALRASKHGASWLYDFAASQLVGVGLTVLLFAVGLGGYKADDSVVNKAAVVAAKQAGSNEIADGYAAFAREIEKVKAWSLDLVPETWRDELSRASVIAAIAAILGGCGLALARAPSRAHMLRDLGSGIAMPGIATVLATAVLEWRAMKGIRATLAGGRSAATFAHEAQDAAREAFPALAVPLTVGAVLVVAGWLLHKRWQLEHTKVLTPRHVLSHFLAIAGVVPWAHLLATIVIEAFTEGATTGVMLAPWVHNRATYIASIALFSFGGALFFAARREVLEIEARESGAPAG